MTQKLLLSAVLFIGLCFVGFDALYAQSGMAHEGDPEPSVGAEGALRLYATGIPLALGPSSATTNGGLATSSWPVSVNSLKLEKTFDGFGFDDNLTENFGFGFIPPDPMGAAGEESVIAVVNKMIEARDRDGELMWRQALRGFFSPVAPTTSTFDPKVVYDPHENRFVVVTLEIVPSPFGGSVSTGNISRILLAVSKTEDPKSPTTADWHYLAIDAKTEIIFQQFGEFDCFADYPGFEVDEEAIYITANMFTFAPFGFFGGSRLWIVDKGKDSGGFYNGGPGSVSLALDPAGDTGLFSQTLMPAKVFGKHGVGGEGSTLGTFLVLYNGVTVGGPGAPEAVQVITVDDPLGKVGGPFFSGEFVLAGDIEDVGGIFGFPELPDAPQALEPIPIEVNDRRALDAVWRKDALWLTTTIIPNSGVDTGTTTAHWFKLDTSAGPGAIVLADGGNIGGEDIAPGTHTFFPAVAVNKEGSAKFGFSASAATIFAGAFATGRHKDDPPGTVQASETVKAGKGPYKRFFFGTRNRWGDYSGISVDPKDDEKFWVFNEFADTPGTPTIGSFGLEDGRWGTAWAQSEIDD